MKNEYIKKIDVLTDVTEVTPETPDILAVDVTYEEPITEYTDGESKIIGLNLQRVTPIRTSQGLLKTQLQEANNRVAEAVAERDRIQGLLDLVSPKVAEAIVKI